MKKSIYFSALLLTILLVSSCGNTNSNTPPASSSPSYYGDWTVTEVVGSTPISAGADESLLGLKASYTKELASFDANQIADPEYKEAELSKEDFLNEYRNQLSDIGISSDSVKTVEITNWTAQPGQYLFIQDEQTMIFLWDGNYYEMKKDK